MWPEGIHDVAPRECHDDEDAAVRGVDPTEVRIRLEGDDHAVADQHERAEQAERPRSRLAQELPHQPAAADLGQAGEDEQGKCASRPPARSYSTGSGGGAAWPLCRLRTTALAPVTGEPRKLVGIEVRILLSSRPTRPSCGLLGGVAAGRRTPHAVSVWSWLRWPPPLRRCPG